MVNWFCYKYWGALHLVRNISWQLEKSTNQQSWKDAINGLIVQRITFAKGIPLGGEIIAERLNMNNLRCNRRVKASPLSQPQSGWMCKIANYRLFYIQLLRSYNFYPRVPLNRLNGIFCQRHLLWRINHKKAHISSRIKETVLIKYLFLLNLKFKNCLKPHTYLRRFSRVININIAYPHTYVDKYVSYSFPKFYNNIFLINVFQKAPPQYCFIFYWFIWKSIH